MILFFLVFILAVIIATFSRAEECYQCGVRSPLVHSHFKTRALCVRCRINTDKRGKEK